MKQTEIFATTPLDKFVPVKRAGFTMSVEPWQGKIILRGLDGDKKFTDGVKAVTKMALPLKPNHFNGSGPDALIWMGPNEWMWSFENIDQAFEKEAELAKKLAGAHASVVNVSDYYVTLSLGGDEARKILQKESSLDFFGEAIFPGAAVQTEWAHTATLILCHRLDQFILHVRWSYAEYLWKFLEEASRPSALL